MQENQFVNPWEVHQAVNPNELDRRFKRCILEACYIVLVGGSKEFRESVASEILNLLKETDAEDFEQFTKNFTVRGNDDFS